MPAVTVVVATRNRRESLLRTLARIAGLPSRPPAIVVDNGSSDGTAEAVRAAHPDVRVLELGRNEGAAGRTAGVRAAATPYAALTDDDAWWERGALPRAVRALDAHPRLALVAARILVGPDGVEDPTCAAMAASPLPAEPDVPGAPVLGFVACGCVVRRSAFLQAGGFHPGLRYMGEEQLLAIELARRGWRLAYVPEVVARHVPGPRRDGAERRRLQARNALWTAWLRRSPAGAARATAAVLRGAGDPAVRGGVADAVRGVRWVLRERRPVGAELERRLRLVDGV